MCLNLKSERAFTLIEIIVVAMVLIVTAIIVIPRLLGSSRRKLPTPLSRIQKELRSMSHVIESYRVDCLTYPAHARGAGGANGQHPAHAAYSITTFRNKRGKEDPISSITTPIAYCVDYPTDPYAGEKGVTFGYYNPTQNNRTLPESWIVWSCGPDRDYDIDPANDYTGTVHPSITLIGKTYDPTNGARSDGDIWLAKEQRPPWVVRQ